MQITYYTKNRFGNIDRVPVSVDAIMITKLTGRKTLSETELKLLADYGHAVERVISPE